MMTPTEIMIGEGPEEITGRGVVYLPIVQSAPPDLGKEFYRLLLTDSRQQRPVLLWDSLLAIAAQRRAAAQFGDGLSHCDQSGVCANAYARAAGFVLPSHYSANGNNIESLTAGTPNVMAAFISLARSPSHARHIFGELDFFRAQNRVGISMVEIPTLRYRYYWSVLIAEAG